MSKTDRAADAVHSQLQSHNSHDRARLVFGGLEARPSARETTVVSSTLSATRRHHHARRARSAAFTTVPVVLTGALALSLGLTGPIDPAHARKPLPKPEQSPSPLGLRAALTQIGAAMMPGGLTSRTASAVRAPAIYTVIPGDTVSSVAQQFSLSTASVLALNGLSWKSTIFPGQVLTLTTAPVKSTGSPTPTTRAGQYRIVKGDTISSLAAQFGVSTQSILDASGLTWTSIVYPGQLILVPGRVPAPTPARAPLVGTAHDAPVFDTLSPSLLAASNSAGVLHDDSVDSKQPAASSAPMVAAMIIVERPVLRVEPRRPAAPSSRDTSSGSPSPAPSPAPSSGPPAGGTVTPLSAEMRTHASTIIQVGRQLGVSEYGIVIALATAMQESSLRNLSWGDRDSVGLFQQRPSSGWGTVADLQVPSHAATLFYVGRSGYTRGLLNIRGWQSMTLTQAAQAVQISAHPTLYANWEASAWAWYFELT